MKIIDMEKNSLVEGKGLSLSQSQSISNLCNQRATEIAVTIERVNNFKKSVKIDGEEKVTVKGYELPTNIVSLLEEKAKLHACQAFLMENVKAKDSILKQLRNADADTSDVVYPKTPEYLNPSAGSLSDVGEEWGKEQLTLKELNEFIDVVAYAAHIGKFIHKDGKLTKLRKEIPSIPAIEWMDIHTGTKTAVDITVHHTSDQLLGVHEQLAAIHRVKEQRVNYFKAKIKNLVTNENARIAKYNADIVIAATKANVDLREAYQTAKEKADGEVRDIEAAYEIVRQNNISKVASMRINVDPRFQDVVDLFLSKLPDTQE